MRFKQLIFFILVVLFLSCVNYINQVEKLKDCTMTVKLFDENNAIIYHFFLENRALNISYSYSFTDKESLAFVVKEGTYDIYYFGLIKKNDTSYMVISYSYEKNMSIHNNLILNMNVKGFFPNYQTIKNSENIIELKIFVSDVIEFSYVSSISVKQGSDRYRSVNFLYDEIKKLYLSNIPIQYSGSWYMNISYTVRYRFNNSIENSGYKLSTSYFSDNFLGVF